MTIKVSAWGMFESVSDQFNSGTGVVAPSPTLTIVINIVPMWPQLEAIDKGLKTVWGGFSLGPKLHVIVPIFIRFRRVLLDKDVIDVLIELLGQADALLMLLRCNDNSSKNRIAAELLADRRSLETADAIRVAAFSNGTLDFPNIDAESIDAWLAELRGPLQEFLLATVQRHGPGIGAWARFWPALGPELRVWLVRRACYEEQTNEDIILKALADPDQHVQHATLVAVRFYDAPVGGVAMQRALNYALSSPSPRVRAASARVELEGSAAR